MDYFAPIIENRDEEEFEHIDNLDNSFDLDQDQFKNFTKLLYLARKLMSLGLHINNYATCSACNKLYEPKYPNYIMSKMRQPCNQQLAKE
ncbi:8135_t:CDS:2, partial [Racocetra persica]